MKVEKWKEIKTCKGYLISSFGRIFSIKSQSLKKPYLHKSRCDYYWRAEIGGKKFMLHRLVASHFKKRSSNDQIFVNHKNLNTLDCGADNLEWCTGEENIKHSYNYRTLNWRGVEYKVRREK